MLLLVTGLRANMVGGRTLGHNFVSAIRRKNQDKDPVSAEARFGLPNIMRKRVSSSGITLRSVPRPKWRRVGVITGPTLVL